MKATTMLNPERRPPPGMSTLLKLRSATRSYLVCCAASLQDPAVTDERLRSNLRAAMSEVGGSPRTIAARLVQLLGEA